MSVLIKGMKKPDHCLRCPAKGTDDECLLQSESANAEYESWEDQMANCPLVPVPPHGRLIDADMCERIDMRPWDAPTIIPASEEGE